MLNWFGMMIIWQLHMLQIFMEIFLKVGILVQIIRPNNRQVFLLC